MFQTCRRTMLGYKDFIRAGFGVITPDKADLVNGLLSEGRCVDSEESAGKVHSVQELIQDPDRIEERKQIADFQHRIFHLVNRRETEYADVSGCYRKRRSKHQDQRSKETAKRRKRNRNKKTHRKK